MSRWRGAVTRSAQEAVSFWREAPLETLFGMMDEPREAWEAWLRVAATVVTSPGSVFEPGCGIGLLSGLLPSGCTYYGCDVNPRYVEEATRLHARPGVTFECRDLTDVIASGERYDWVVVPSLFGMFPERDSYDLMTDLWGVARKGLSVTTLDKRRAPRSPSLPFQFTAHDPEELLRFARGLPGAEPATVRSGRDFPELRPHRWSRGLVLRAWRGRQP